MLGFKDFFRLLILFVTAFASDSYEFSSSVKHIASPTTVERIRKLTPTIEAYGSKFFYSNNGSQFFIKGIAYQQDFTEYLRRPESLVDVDAPKTQTLCELNFRNGRHFVDPLAWPDICTRDLPYLQELGVNTLRVYSIDPRANHDVCMERLAEAGIYVILDLSNVDCSINRDDPSWDLEIMDCYTSVIDTMAPYDNVLGFFAGNEVNTDVANTYTMPFVKSSIRDIKSYIKRKNIRKIPVGYSSNDDSLTRNNLADYLVCGENDLAKIDFFGINMYEWCGYSSYATSGYKERTLEMAGYPVPVFLSEFGCNLKRPRPFTEVEAIFNKPMTNVWSGAIMYMYFEERNEYGVVKVKGDYITDPVEKLPDFNLLKAQYRNASPKGVNKQDYSSHGSKDVQCPVASEDWKVSEELPSTPRAPKCDCMMAALKCSIEEVPNRSELAEIVGYICGEISCHNIVANGTTGWYGEFSDCSFHQKLSYVAQLYYNYHNSTPDACYFEGYGRINAYPNTLEALAMFKTLKGTRCKEELGPVKEISRLITGEPFGSQNRDSPRRILVDSRLKNTNLDTSESKAITAKIISKSSLLTNLIAMFLVILFT
ncbi:1,3-beta-glucanosyltransferase [Komagataella phaffii CBS 7435]|uniref:1,3-beta-glucanosyltransferase n=2 Tax=Komagataella phaffii TaxID=460519 RepID=C4R460_KOMPG|nr:1,3-beta-glucanosyltransferase [Komagataella phaffii GS115]AOA63243.1 GQ67_03365T0 [Komagataella phaffii]CAH2449907.1 1,3-beta-glucanosyltransferase [Komagataella phaffii CBS 7435]AOA68727.1 GQ68_03334T0 [Komagataella phaffii GS115]CAY70346.1 1,3-beta-glucanosyltransferase [Komagataella phaffii GS115]CCA39861.1 1,3-beta-glucanosyltransferase [Komagataella phaffii CBS 7435]